MTQNSRRRLLEAMGSGAAIGAVTSIASASSEQTGNIQIRKETTPATAVDARQAVQSSAGSELLSIIGEPDFELSEATKAQSYIGDTTVSEAVSVPTDVGENSGYQQ